DMALRRACIEALALVGDPADAPALIDVARRFRALEGSVAATLRALGARDQFVALAEIYRRRLKWADDQAPDDFCELAGEARVPHLLEALGTRYYPVARAAAARALARTRTREAVFALRSRSLSDPHEEVRLAAAGALQALGCPTPSAEEAVGYGIL